MSTAATSALPGLMFEGSAFNCTAKVKVAKSEMRIVNPRCCCVAMSSDQSAHMVRHRRPGILGSCNRARRRGRLSIHQMTMP